MHIPEDLFQSSSQWLEFQIWGPQNSMFQFLGSKFLLDYTLGVLKVPFDWIFLGYVTIGRSCEKGVPKINAPKLAVLNYILQSWSV